MDKNNKIRRRGNKRHSNTVPKMTPEGTNKHSKMFTVERNRLDEIIAWGKPKKTRIRKRIKSML